MTSAPPLAFRFRSAVEADFERLLDLSVRVMRPHLERVGRWNPARRRSRMRESFDPATMRLIEVEGALAGCVTAEVHTGFLEIQNFYLEPAWQGRGLGNLVLAALLAEHPGLPVRLEVLKESPAARFYERAGFLRIAEQPFDWVYERPARA